MGVAQIVPVSETVFLAQLLDLARLLGWRSAHFRAARTVHGWRTPVGGDGAGFPDLLLVRGRRLLAVELKSARGALSDTQAAWLTALELAGAETYILRPADFDRAVEILR